MLTITELNALEARVVKTFRSDYFGDANEERVTRWLEFFFEMDEALRTYTKASKKYGDKVRNPKYTRLLEISTFARQLFEQQLTAFLTTELPAWLYEKVKSEFNDDFGIAYAGKLRDLDADGLMQRTDADLEIVTIMEITKVWEAKRKGGTVRHRFNAKTGRDVVTVEINDAKDGDGPDSQEGGTQ